MISRKAISYSLITLSLPFLVLGPSEASDVILSWEPNTEADPAGYQVYCESESGGAPYDGQEPVRATHRLTYGIRPTMRSPDSVRWRAIFALCTLISRRV
jgi:hypothetical protein